MNTTHAAPTADDADAVAALVDARLAIAAQLGILRDLGERPGAGRGIERALACYETGDLWLGEAIEDAREG